jgi:hypothetical protein
VKPLTIEPLFWISRPKIASDEKPVCSFCIILTVSDSLSLYFTTRLLLLNSFFREDYIVLYVTVKVSSTEGWIESESEIEEEFKKTE